MHRRHLLALPALIPALAHAQTAAWPNRTVTMVAPLAAGSSVDIMARLVAEQWATRLPGQVVVENRPAANGTLAMEQVSRSAPDGYTAVLIGQTGVAFNPHIYPALRYDPLKDFTYVSTLAGVSNALVVRAASPFHSVADILAAARAAPGRLTYSSGGVGTTHHVSSAMLAQMTGVEFTHVPYRGAPQGILAVTTGEVDFAYYNISTILGGVRGGTLRALAVTSPTASAFLPGVPTMVEAGVPGYQMQTWFGVATVAGTPAPIIDRMWEVTRGMLADEAVRRRLTELGFELVEPVPPEGMPALVQAEHAKWGPILRAAGARVE
ncbi:Bug family tripartite tricarboxylate transporter substrate binding protein [Humitalea sp. 24SJ18S-53]|uniref:Bug family tripartite tricarboxylate transporter substrate binding protein n=1 Tax=Humitalea sp. 24SJ18S-53 TaxID=3422307 RepID=UPI003D66EAE8